MTNRDMGTVRLGSIIASEVERKVKSDGSILTALSFTLSAESHDNTMRRVVRPGNVVFVG